MKDIIIKAPGKTFFALVAIFLLCFLGEGFSSSSVDRAENQDQEVEPLFQPLFI